MTVSQKQNPTVLSMARTIKKPLLVFVAMPFTGHTSPPLQLAQELISRGYEVLFISSSEFQAGIEKVGAEWHDFPDAFPPGSLEARGKLPPGPARLLYDQRAIFIDSMPARSQVLRSVLEMVRERDPERKVIIVNESCSFAVLPFMYGAPLPKGYDRFPDVVSMNVIPLIVTSHDTAPFGPGLPPDSSEVGRVRNKFMYDLMYAGPFEEMNQYFQEKLKSLGCTDLPKSFYFDVLLSSYKTMFQMCSPSMDYPRSDLDLSIRFVGALPTRPVDPAYEFPSWWDDLTRNAALAADAQDRKKVVAVSQGTIATDYSEVLIPAMTGLAGRSDVMQIVILGVRGASLPADTQVPKNAKVVDYVPYDALLPFTDVFVTNGGFGSFVHGAINGVPMVVSGVTEDKMEVTARAEYCGMAVNLKTQTPSSEAIAEAADKIFKDSRYKQRALRLKQDNQDLDAVHIIERQIEVYTKG
ncbi:glycosyltransferase family 1 protein [Xylariaceae sp. FL0016]|nr:glycosyltransferase family 1 protein [Xylariaceae sp. FL0016]